MRPGLRSPLKRSVGPRNGAVAFHLRIGHVHGEILVGRLRESVAGPENFDAVEIPFTLRTVEKNCMATAGVAQFRLHLPVVVLENDALVIAGSAGTSRQKHHTENRGPRALQELLHRTPP